MAATGSRLRPCCLGHRENSVMHFRKLRRILRPHSLAES
jgi:hypothetical protein